MKKNVMHIMSMIAITIWIMKEVVGHIADNETSNEDDEADNEGETYKKSEYQFSCAAVLNEDDCEGILCLPIEYCEGVVLNKTGRCGCCNLCVVELNKGQRCSPELQTTVDTHWLKAKRIRCLTNLTCDPAHFVCTEKPPEKAPQNNDDDDDDDDKDEDDDGGTIDMELTKPQAERSLDKYRGSNRIGPEDNLRRPSVGRTSYDDYYDNMT